MADADAADFSPDSGDCHKFGGVSTKRGYFRVCSLTGGGRVAWIVRLVQIGGEGEGQATDVIEIDRPDDLGDIADLGLTLGRSEAVAGRSPTGDRRRTS
jgi:hypothetical protein